MSNFIYKGIPADLVKGKRENERRLAITEGSIASGVYDLEFSLLD